MAYFIFYKHRSLCHTRMHFSTLRSLKYLFYKNFAPNLFSTFLDMPYILQCKIYLKSVVQKSSMIQIKWQIVDIIYWEFMVTGLLLLSDNLNCVWTHFDCTGWSMHSLEI